MNRTRRSFFAIMAAPFLAPLAKFLPKLPENPEFTGTMYVCGTPYDTNDPFTLEVWSRGLAKECLGRTWASKLDDSFMSVIMEVKDDEISEDIG